MIFKISTKGPYKWIKCPLVWLLKCNACIYQYYGNTLIKIFWMMFPFWAIPLAVVIFFAGGMFLYINGIFTMLKLYITAID